VPLVAGFDSSTQSTKVEVRDADTGALVASGRARHPATTPPRSEQDPAAWWDALEAAFAAAGSPEVAAVSVAAQQHGLVVLGGRGEVLRPAKLWNDTESTPQAAALRRAWGPRVWARRVGSVPVPSFTVTKLAWLRDNEPRTFASVRHVCLPHDWLTWRLSGELVTDRGDASGTGYWSPGTGAWCLEALGLVDAEIDWPARLPAIRPPLEAAGAGRIAGRSVLVAAGTGDNMSAALGLGLVPGDLAISIGTSGTVFAVSDDPVADPTGAVAGFADATGRFLPLVCTLNATKVTSAVGDLLGCDTRELDRLALEAVPGAGGLVLLPYFDGERTPDRPDATGVLAGIRSNVTRPQLARAAFEGVVCGLLDGVDALADAGVRTDGRLFLVGGGARSPAFRAIVAQLARREVIAAEGAELVATGACVQAAATLEGLTPQAVSAAWGLGLGVKVKVQPDLPAGAATGGWSPHALRAAYHALRDTF